MRRDKGKKIRIDTVLLLLVLSVAIGFLLFIGTSIFHISDITVQGNNRISYDEIIEHTHVGPGTNILRVRLKDVKERLQNHPYILEADIKRRIPRGLVITIEERHLIGYIPYMGSYLLLDNEARVVSATSQMPVKGLPVFNGVKVKDFQVENVLDIDNNIEYDKIIYISEYIKKSISQYSPIQVDVTDLQHLTIDLDGRFTLKLGGIEELNYKLEFSNTILAELYPQDVGGEIDVSRGEKAFFRPW